uniref:THAP-type domain-containing protein n=2 Tax=Amphimedon queenslandica TaxID=400682 RepID=A0A1X7VAJ4_AMPQE
MLNCCVAYGCSNTTNVAGISTYYFPKDSCLKNKVVAQRTRDKWSGPTALSVLCCNHFSQDCFEGGFELGKGFEIKKKRKQKRTQSQPYSRDISMMTVTHHYIRRQRGKRMRKEDKLGESVTAAVCHYSVDDNETVDMSPEPNPPEPETQLMKLTSTPESQVKYIVLEECLLSLFEFCHHCHFPCTNTRKYICGTFICITQNCNICEAVNTWESQPLMKGIPAGNILLSASILFSGSLPEQALRMLNHFCCSTITPRTFFLHQDSYLLPAILRVWDQYQQAFVSQFSSENTALVFGGEYGPVPNIVLTH